MKAGGLVVGIGPDPDAHLEAVARSCRSLGFDFVILDYAKLPADGGIALDFQNDLVRVGGFEIEQGQASAVWWRRPEPPRVSSLLQDPRGRRFAANEWYQCANGLPELLAPRRINAPGACGVAHSKSLQLATAGDVGFLIPRTLITNREIDARRFLEEIEVLGGRVVVKTLGALPDVSFPTRIIDAEAKASLAEIRWSPVIMQEYIECDVDIRAVVVGTKVFASEIHIAPAAYAHDYRVDLRAATIRPIPLPSLISSRLVALTNRLGLDFGAADLRRSRDGKYYFLEVNPSGEWLFLGGETATAVTDAMAHLLTYGES